MKTMNTKAAAALTAGVLVVGSFTGCSLATSDSVVSGQAIKNGAHPAESKAPFLAVSSSVNGGVALPDPIKQMAAGQKGTAQALVKKQADKAYENLVKDALTKSLGTTVTNALGSAFGPLASMATGMIFDKIFGTIPDSTQVKLDQIIAAIDNLHADMTQRFDSVDTQLTQLNDKADKIITAQAQAKYSKAYQDLNDGQLARLKAAQNTQEKIAKLLSPDSAPEAGEAHGERSALSESQVKRLTKLVEEFDSQSHQIVLDLAAWQEHIAGLKEGTEQPVPGVIAAYQELVTTKRRYLSAYEYQAIKAQALRWQAYSVMATEVALTGARMEAADGLDVDARVVERFVGEGGGAEAIQNAIPASNWAPLKADGTPDPNGAFLLDTKTGSLVVKTENVKAYPSYTYIQRELRCDLMNPVPCNRGRTPKWRPPVKGIEDHLAANYNDRKLKPSTPVVPDGSLVTNGSKLQTQYFGQVPEVDQTLLEARTYSVPAGTQFAAYWPSEAGVAQPVAKDARIMLGSEGFSYAQGGDEDVSLSNSPLWVSEYFERFTIWKPTKSGAQVVKETSAAQYKSRLCGSTEKRHNKSTIVDYSTPAKCDKGVDQEPVYTGYKKSVKPVSVDGLVLWYVPLTPDQLGRGLNLVGVPTLR